jgi:hypothetical protein
MGTIEPIKECLFAPFSAKPCVAYEYNVYHVSQTDGSSKVYDFEGWAVAPCVVKASFGKVKILPQRGRLWDNPWKGIKCFFPLRRQKMSCPC